MRLLSPRLLIPLAVLVVVWGGAHLLTSHDVSVSPAVWPVTAPTASPAPGAAAPVPAVPTAAPSPSASTGGIPILPGALQQLNGSTRDTAVGLYALIQQLEEAMRSRLEQLVKQLEPGR
jgi:hypothetical protein